MCKHLHVASVGASERSVDVADLRRARAEEVYKQGMYTVTEDTVEVMDENGNGGIVEIVTKKCMCIANSHGVDCVCLIVASLAGALSTDQQDVDEQQPDHITLSVEEPNARERKVDSESLIEELYHWSKGPSFKESNDLQNSLLKAHLVAFGSFSKRRNRSKITPLHPYRKKINAAKRILQTKQSHVNEVTTASTVQKKRSVTSDHCMESFKRKGGCIQSRSKYHKRMKLPQLKANKLK